MPELGALIFSAVESYCCCLKEKQPLSALIFLNTQTLGENSRLRNCSLVVNMYSCSILLTWIKRALVKKPRSDLSILTGGYLYDSSSRRNVQKVRESHPDETNKYKLPIAGQTAVS